MYISLKLSLLSMRKHYKSVTNTNKNMDYKFIDLIPSYAQYQIGSVTTNFLISFFAEYSVLDIFITSGALFQSLKTSPIIG